jgi:hypothetical protein
MVSGVIRQPRHVQHIPIDSLSPLQLLPQQILEVVVDGCFLLVMRPFHFTSLVLEAGDIIFVSFHWP